MLAARTNRSFSWAMVAGLLFSNAGVAEVVGVEGLAEQLDPADEEGHFDETLTGNWGGARRELWRAGVIPYVSVYLGGAVNMAGGGKAGGAGMLFSEFGVALELERLLGWSGGWFNINWHGFLGPSPLFSQANVGLFSTWNINGWEANRAFRFYNIYLQQDWFDEALLLQVGQLAADDVFMATGGGGLFLNAAFGEFPSAGANLPNLPVYPVAAPGLYVVGKPVPWWVLRAGLYTGYSGADEASNIGFDWTLGESTGFIFVWETEIHAPGPDATSVSLGGWVGHTPGGFPYTADPGGSASTTASFYFTAQGEVRFPAGGALLLFARGTASPDLSVNPMATYAEAGLALSRFLPARLDDAIALGVSFGQFTQAYIDAQTAGPPLVRPGQGVLELTYVWALPAGASVQPDFQWVFLPGYAEEAAYVLGVQVAGQL